MESIAILSWLNFSLGDCYISTLLDICEEGELGPCNTSTLATLLCLDLKTWLPMTYVFLFNISKSGESLYYEKWIHLCSLETPRAIKNISGSLLYTAVPAIVLLGVVFSPLDSWARCIVLRTWLMLGQLDLQSSRCLETAVWKTLLLPLSRRFIKRRFEAFQVLFSQKKKNIFGRVFIILRRDV